MDLDDVEEEDGDGDDSDEDELGQGGHWSACPEMHRQRRSGRRRLHSWSLVAPTVLVLPVLLTTIHSDGTNSTSTYHRTPRWDLLYHQQCTTVPPDGTHCTIRWDPSHSDYLYCKGQSLLDQATISDEDNLAGG